MHLDGLSDLAYRQIQIDTHDLIDEQRNVGLLGHLKALLLRRNGVHADRQKRKHIVAGLASRGLASQVGPLIRQGHLGACHHRAAGVLDSAHDLARRRLSP